MLNDRSSADEELIEAGLRDYADAILAVRRFEEMLQEKCRKAIAEHLSEIIDVTGLRRGATGICPYQEYLWKGEVAPSVGAWLEPTVESAKVTAIDLGICWSKQASAADYIVDAYASIYLRYKKQAVLLKKARFKKEEPEEGVDQNYGHSLTVYAQVVGTSPDYLYQHLGKVLEKWLSGKTKIKDVLE